jgi:hypothetical protein
MTRHASRYATLLLLSALIAYVHTRGVERGWYWEYPWLDLPTHFLGGLLIGLMARWGSERLRGHQISFTATIAFVIVVGIAWEAFELALGLIEVSWKVYITDTLLDLALDSAGGVFAAARRRRSTSDVLGG